MGYGFLAGWFVPAAYSNGASVVRASGGRKAVVPGRKKLATESFAHFGENIPALASDKWKIGHTLGLPAG